MTGGAHLPAAAASGPVAPADVSVVICAYTEGRWDDLVAAVGSVLRQTAPPRELIVVIDGNEALLARARAELPGPTVVASRGPRGLSGARNTGASLATGVVVAFLDDDAVAEPQWLERLARGYADADVVGVGGPAIAAWDGGRPPCFPAEFEWVVGCSYRGLPEVRAWVRNPIGANMSLRRWVLEEVGGFDTEVGRVGAVPVGCEETELCIRVGQRWPGARILHEPEARVHHRVPRERATLSYFRSRCFSEGRSKALVAALAGAGDGLSSERSYAVQVLPRGVVRGLADALRGDPAGLVRAALIAVGLAITTAGYVAGLLRRRPLVAGSERSR